MGRFTLAVTAVTSVDRWDVGYSGGAGTGLFVRFFTALPTFPPAFSANIAFLTHSAPHKAYSEQGVDERRHGLRRRHALLGNRHRHHPLVVAFAWNRDRQKKALRSGNDGFGNHSEQRSLEHEHNATHGDYVHPVAYNMSADRTSNYPG